MADIDTLVDKWGEGNVQAAFWLSKHIKTQGLDGIGFMKKAEGRLQSTAEFTTKQKVEQAMDEKY